MGIDYDTFREWAESRFDQVICSDKEIRINSIFEEDDGCHLWCSPSGGKKGYKLGVFHCFKTDKGGSLVKLVMLVDHCDYDDALSVLHGQTSLRNLELQLDQFFAAKDEQQDKPIPPGLALPENSVLITDLGLNSWWRKKSQEYLTARKIPIEGLYVCTEGKYKTRIVIPYYDEDGRLIYWNARTFGKSKVRYLGPSKDCGTGKSNVVYMPGSWASPGSVLYVCEGEFNAMSLRLAGLPAAACGGKEMSGQQAMILQRYKLVLCLDRDKPGRRGTSKMLAKISPFLRSRNTEAVTWVRPPLGFKDWNEMLVKDGTELMRAYIAKMQKPLEFNWPYGTAGDYFTALDL